MMKKRGFTAFLLTMLMAASSCVTAFAENENVEGEKYEAYFYVKRTSDIAPDEPKSQPVKNYYTSMKIAGLISEHQVITGAESVEKLIVKAPTAAEFEAKGVPIDADKQYIEWYVIKEEGDNWHVDGIIQPKCEVVFDYSDSFMGDAAKGKIVCYVEPGTVINMLEANEIFEWSEVDDEGNNLLFTKTFNKWNIGENKYNAGAEMLILTDTEFVADYMLETTVSEKITEEIITEVETENSTEELETSIETETESESEIDEIVDIEMEDTPLGNVVIINDNREKTSDEGADEEIVIEEEQIPLFGSIGTGDDSKVILIVSIAAIAVLGLLGLEIFSKIKEKNE